MTTSEKPILFHYPGSIYSYRTLWYLWLRGIQYDECIQPYVMPRPDLAALGIQYRRIPIMAIGKDIFIDSRLMISKLEKLYPNSTLAPSTPAEQGIRKLFENYTIDGGVFGRTVQLMPYWHPMGVLQDKTFLDDREKLSGRRMTAEGMRENRPDGLQHIRQVFDLMETTFLEDGRRWVLGGDEPSVADIDAVWPLSWLITEPGMSGALPEEFVSEKKFPRTYAWVLRFMDEVNKRKASASKPETLNQEAMLERVLVATSTLPAEEFIQNDPLQVQAGDEVEVFPVDYGQAHKDRGAVIGLTVREVVIRNSKGLHLHFPRWNFRINKVTPSIPKSVSPAAQIPKMRLIYHHASPFTRKVYMLAIELGLAQQIKLEKVVVCPVPFPGWSDNNQDVAVYNPMAKIPCLVPEDVQDGIFDSRIICEYLNNLAGVKAKNDRRHWQMRTLHACADGIMDAAVLITYEIRIREERGLKFDEWIEGQKAKMVRGLDRFEAAALDGVLANVTDGKAASVDDIAVSVATAMTASMRFIGLDWSKGRPKLVEWMKNWQARKSFLDTPPEKEWGVEAKTAPKI